MSTTRVSGDHLTCVSQIAGMACVSLIWSFPRIRANRFGGLLFPQPPTRRSHSCVKAKARREIQRFKPSRQLFHLGHNHLEKQNVDDGKEGQAITWVGAVADILLSLGKMAAGILGNSSALIADSLHSLSDVFVDGVTLWTHHLARRPWSQEHPYGLGKFETIGAMGVSLSLILTAIGIMAHSGSYMMHMEPELAPTNLALAAALGSLIVKEVLYQKTIAVAKAENSDLIAANAWHHRTDAISSGVALLGVAGAMYGYPLLDPLAGIAVAGFIAQTGYEMFTSSIKELTDNQRIDQETIQAISQLIETFPEAKGHHNLRSRKMGVYSLVDFHLTVNPRLTVTAAHQIAEKIRTKILEDIPQVREALIHVEGAVLDDSAPYHQEFKLHPSEKEVTERVSSLVQSRFPSITQCQRFSVHYIGDTCEVSFSISVLEDTQLTETKQLATLVKKEIEEQISYISHVVVWLELTPGKNE